MYSHKGSIFFEMESLRVLFLVGQDAHPCHGDAEERAAFAVGVVSSRGRLRLHFIIPIRNASLLGFFKICIETNQWRLKSLVFS